MAKQKRQTPHDPDLLARFFSDVTLAVRLLLDRRVSSTAKLIPLVMVVYILSPLDLIPDVFLPFGIVDDITALLVGLQLFIHSAPRDVVQGYRQGRRAERGPADHDIVSGESGTIIEGEYIVREDRRQDRREDRHEGRR
jgi:uncharacterized membrane protein YkvA (DUF1232 family)